MDTDHSLNLTKPLEPDLILAFALGSTWPSVVDKSLFNFGFWKGRAAFAARPFFVRSAGATMCDLQALLCGPGATICAPGATLCVPVLPCAASKRYNVRPSGTTLCAPRRYRTFSN